MDEASGKQNLKSNQLKTKKLETFHFFNFRHLFRDTDQIPEIMENVLYQLEEQNLTSHPVYIHCLCDTGVMCYQANILIMYSMSLLTVHGCQGLDIAMTKTGISMNIKGVIWDSCPGPYPEVTLLRWVTIV